MEPSAVVAPSSVSTEVEEKPRARNSQTRGFSRFFPGLAAGLCVAFGIALIANTQLANDGGWFWYAVLHHSGQRLYRDLHLVLQPFAVLETEWWMDLVGKGWIASKILAVIHLLAFVMGISLVAAKSRLAGLKRAVLIACVFFVGIFFEHYRFDDYHVIFHSIFLFSIAVLLALGEMQTFTWKLSLVLALGALAGLGITTRLTDGMMLGIFVVVALVYQAKARKAVLALAFLGVTAFVARGIVYLTGDSLRDYLTCTVFSAAGPKGGLENILPRPFSLVWNSAVFLRGGQGLLVLLCSAVAASSWTWLVAPISRTGGPNSTIKAVVGMGLLGTSIYLLLPAMENGDLVVCLSAAWIVAAYGAVIWLACRLVLELLKARTTARADSRRVILLGPFLLLVSGALSTAGYHFGLYAPVALFILVLAAVAPSVFERRWLRSCFLTIAALMAISGACRKTLNPASWHSYATFPMFSHRILVHHPSYGLMVIDKSLHEFIGPICSAVKADSGSELLSIPFPYANYYCDVPPWQGFVQSFFDTSSKITIDDMMTKLQHSPPKWVLYQRQMDNLERHEIAFNNGGRLPHRDLDEFIVAKLVGGQWQLVMRAEYGVGSDWWLIRTN